MPKASGKHRSQLVAKDINNGDGPGMYSPTPPLEGMKFLLTMAASGEHTRRASGSRRLGRSEDSVLMHIDVRRAYFIARVEKDIFVEIPPEDRNAGEPKQRGKLIEAMQGTSQAEVTWQAEVQKAMSEIGMEAGAYLPCAFRHRGVAQQPSSMATTFWCQGAGMWWTRSRRRWANSGRSKASPWDRAPATRRSCSVSAGR